MSTFRFVEPEALSRPAKGLAHNMINDWWLVDEKGRIAFFTRKGRNIYASPQCNASEDVARRLLEGHKANRVNDPDSIFAWATDVVQLPLVSFPINPSDFAS